MSYYKTFANHPKQIVQFQQDRRVARVKDGKLGTFKWQPCPMNGHNDAAGSWSFEMDDGEVVYLNGYIHDTYPWRIPNRYRHATGAELIAAAFEAKEAEMAAELEAAKAEMAMSHTDIEDDLVNRICDLVDMIVDDRVKTDDYNYVVAQLEEMMA